MNTSNFNALLLSLVILIPIMCFVVVKICKNNARNWIKRHSEDLISQNRALYNTCIANEANLSRLQQKFVFAINSLGLSDTFNCSSLVLSNAENDRLNYLFKYSNLDSSDETLQKIDFCIGFVTELEEYKHKMNLFYVSVKQILPSSVKFWLKEKSIPYYICGFNHSDGVHKIVPPVYRFVYTSPAGRNTRVCAIEMNRDFLIRIHNRIVWDNRKATFTKTQRNLMSSELREYVKKRDNYTCCKCGNSVYNEPNLLLEVDHIIPVSKGGRTELDNLQTLCWKCNREKSDKI